MIDGYQSYTTVLKTQYLSHY